jgi:hypothetical protein
MTKILRFKDKDTTISDIVNIPSGYILEIEPGSTLKFTPNAGIVSYSPIRAMGTPEAPISLLPSEEGASWKGVAVIEAVCTSEFHHVRMSRTTAGNMGEVQLSGGLSVLRSSAVIEGVELIDFLSEDALHLHNSRFQITGLTISHSHSDALDSDWSYGTVTDSRFINSGGDGVDLCGSWAVITNCLIESSADKGISIGEGSVAYVTGAEIIGNRTGVAAKDQSLVSLTNCQISDNEYGILRYIKKPIYVYPEMILENNQFHGNSETIHEEEPQSWTRRFD